MSQQFMFTTPFQVEVKDNEVTLDGFISTSGVDLVNDIVTKNCLKSMLEQIRERNIKLDLEHESFKGENNEEKEIAKTIVPIGRIVDGTLEEGGLRVKSVLNKFHRRFNETKGSVQQKFLDAFSIAFIPTEVRFEQKNGEKVRMLEDMRLLNVALTGNPVNTEAQISSVIVKSLDYLEKGLDDPGQYAKKKLPPKRSGGVPSSTEGDEDEEDKGKKKKKGTPDDSMVAGAFKPDKKGVIEDYKNEDLDSELEVKSTTLTLTAKFTDEQIKSINDIAFPSNSHENNNHKEVKNMAEEMEKEKVEESTEATAPAKESTESESKSISELKSQVAKLTETVQGMVDAKAEAKPKAVLHKATEEIQERKIQPLDILR